MSVLTIFDLLGVFVFAITGALAANRNNMDVFGHIVLAMFPAIGGGTLRDLILDAPVFWLAFPAYIWVAIVAAILVYFFPPKIGRRMMWLEWGDAVGLALFCVMGTAKTYALTGSVTISVTMGVVTASFGGVIRDVICNEIPLIFQKEIYATAALLGGLVYCICTGLGAPNSFALSLGGVCAFILRGCALHFGWSLPQRKRQD